VHLRDDAVEGRLLPYYLTTLLPYYLTTCGMTRWKVDSLYPKPGSIVHSWRKFSAVLGTTSLRSCMTTRPAGSPPMVMSKKTW